MTKQNSNPIGHPVARNSRGVTLVELLVVMSILSIIAVILIPRLRVINKDRNIREAARIVASAFSKASARAINDGSAGLMIVPNPNFQGPTSFEDAGDVSDDEPFFAGTRIFQMRQLPRYIGDDETASATINGNEVTISPVPFEHTATNPLIQVNDEISFGGSSYRYRISDVSLNGAVLTLDDPAPAPLPTLGSGAPFVVHRQPRRLESSEVELPEGYLIDLRYSGPLVRGIHGTYLNQTPQAPQATQPTSIWMQFDANGGISRLYFDDPVYDEGTNGLQPTGALNWLVTQYDPNALDPVSGAPASREQDPIFSPSNKWVTVDSVTGSVNVASGAVPQAPSDLRDAILQSRAIAVGRQSAAQ